MSDPLEETQPMNRDDVVRAIMEARFDEASVKLFASAAIEWFKNERGQNYVQCVVTDTNTGEEYTLTMQRSGGIAPSQKAARLLQTVEILSNEASFRDKRSMAHFARVAFEANKPAGEKS
jgi:hypothetical protein